MRPLSLANNAERSTGTSRYALAFRSIGVVEVIVSEAPLNWIQSSEDRAELLSTVTTAWLAGDGHPEPALP